MKFLFAIIFAALIVTGCKDNNGCMAIKPESEQVTMLAYAAANGMNPTKHSSGLYYEILAQGAGPTPDINSKITVTYTGKHMNGTVFDQATNPTSFPGYTLKDFIEGWRIGLPLIQKGGHIKLIVPSSLAYGCSTTSSSMPPNSILYFDIQLIDVQ